MTTWDKVMFGLLFFLLLSNIIMASLLYLHGRNAFSSTFPITNPGSQDDLLPGDSSPCITEHCVLTAARILESLDATIDPCHDFYEFSW